MGKVSIRNNQAVRTSKYFLLHYRQRRRKQRNARAIILNALLRKTVKTMEGQFTFASLDELKSSLVAMKKNLALQFPVAVNKFTM